MKRGTGKMADANENLQDLLQAEKEKVKKAFNKCIYFAKELQKAKAEIERLKQ